MNTKRAGFEDGIKLAISAGLALSALQGRVAQGARVAPGILSSMGHAASTGARATPVMGAVVRNAGQDVRAAAGMNRALANPTTQAMQGRVAGAIRAEAANPAAMRGTNQLSRAYEGYMNPAATTAYTPQHMGHVMGINPASINLRTGPTQTMKDLGQRAAPEAFGATVPARRAAAQAQGTVPARRVVNPALAVTQPAVSL